MLNNPQKSSGMAIVFLALTIVIPTSSSLAQNTVSGTIIGVVRDRKSNAPVPQAKVKIVNDANGRVRTTIANTQGEYRLPFLPEGSYTVTATKETYLPEVLPKFPVQFGQYNTVGSKYHKLVVDIKLSRPTLNGQVSDEAGRTLAGAEVVVTDQSSSVTRAARTNQDGGYAIPDLPPGYYFINASWNGERVRGGPILLDREEVWAPIIKFGKFSVTADAAGNNESPGAQAQSQSSAVTTGRQASEGEKVASLAPAVDATRSANFNERQINSLPLGGATYMRSFDELALLVAGVAPPPYTPGARGPGVGFGVGTAGQFSVNGMRARANNFSVDGSDNNDADVGVRRQGFVALTPQSIESVDALSVATLLWDAELGRNAGGQVNVVSKYGMNQLHGQVYGFFNDSSLNARNFFDYSGGAAGGQDPFTRTQLGASIGGPVVKDRTHFFASFERQIINASTEQHFATPAREERRFVDLTRFGFANPDVFSAFVLGTPQNFDKASPLGENILSLYPLPNFTGGPFGANTYTQVLPADGDGAEASLRLTQQFAERHTFNARYNFTDDERALPSVNRAISSALDSETRSHNLSLVFDSALSETRFNQARFSFGRTRLDFYERPGSPFIFEKSRSVNINLPQGQLSELSTTGPIGELHIVPYSPVGAGVFYFPQNRASNTFQYADTFTWMLDKHEVKFGGNVRRYHLNSRLDRLYRPQVAYSGALVAAGQARIEADGRLIFAPNANRQPEPVSGLQLASLGAASAVLQTITAGAPDSTVGLRFNEYHLFVNDNWRVRPKFTVDFGVRYEYSSPPHSVDGRIESALALEGLPTPGNSRFDSPSRTNKFNNAVNAYRQILDGRERIYDADQNNFGPHAGFAWAPGEDGKTAVRGGYGIYYDMILGAVVTQSRNVFPREIPINVDPSFLQFDFYTLNNPANLRLVRDANGNFTNPVYLLSRAGCNQFNTCNQFGGAPGDFVGIIGQLFAQNAPGGGLAFTLTEKRLRTPYAQHWHLTLEREVLDDYFFSAAYVGTKGTKLTRLITPNLGQVVTPYVTLANKLINVQTGQMSDYATPVIFNPLVGSASGKRPNEHLGAYQIYENSAGSIYHALQLEAGKRYDKGYQFTAAYTWSHAIDDVSDVFTLAGAPILPQDSTRLRLERGSANFDLRHRFAASLIWDLPFGENGGRVSRRLFGDWQVASIFQAQTGQPFTLNLPFDANLDGNLTDRPATTTGLSFIDEHGPRRVALDPGRKATDFGAFDPKRNGAVGRNTVRGDGLVNLDLALSKIFSFTERQKLTFRAEFFNALNRANFGLPIRTIGAPGFGSAVETVNPARTIQFALKYSF